MVLRSLILTLVLIAGMEGTAVAQQAARALAAQRIVAVVNDDVVSLRDLEERLQLILVTSGVPDTPEARERLAPQVLRGLIEETLQLQEAERLDIQVTPGEIDQALNSIAGRNNMTVDEMRRFLARNGVSPATLDRQLRAQIAWVKVINRQIRPRVAVTVDQLELAVEEARENQGQPELLLSEIVLPVDSPAQEAAVAADAQRLAQTLREGADFGSLARQVSVAASAEAGGDVGWVPASRIPPELLVALERMAPGDISPPIKSAVGYHIFALRDRRLGAPNPVSDDAEVRLTQILFPAESDADGADLERLRAQAAALRPDLESCPAMVETAEELAAPASGELGWLRLADLPRELAEPLVTLPEGEVSQPLRGPAGIHLLMVCERRGGGASTLDREAIAQRLENERIERLARRYLRDLRKQAFVEVRL
ncbi:MAG TPA: peptidylprolyl isomerase [Geminicoccaceae bacterium]